MSSTQAHPDSSKQTSVFYPNYYLHWQSYISGERARTSGVFERPGRQVVKDGATDVSGICQFLCSMDQPTATQFPDTFEVLKRKDSLPESAKVAARLFAQVEVPWDGHRL